MITGWSPHGAEFAIHPFHVWCIHSVFRSQETTHRHGVQYFVTQHHAHKATGWEIAQPADPIDKLWYAGLQVFQLLLLNIMA